MSQYPVSVINFPAKRLLGMNVRITMQTAAQDCPALWMRFGPRITELLPAGSVQESYGVNEMLGADECAYWATIEAVASLEQAADMASIDLPAGPYAQCTVSSLEKLMDAYTYLYEVWPTSQNEFTADLQAASFEKYPPNWQIADALEIYLPLKKKA